MSRLPIVATLLSLFALPAFADDEPKPSIPDGLKGFSGQLKGVVVKVVENGFILKVTGIGKTWEKNKAENPESAVGKKLLVNVQWVKGDDGQWRPFENHVRFVGTLEEGEKIVIEVVNDEGERLHILELSEEQRARARGGDGEGRDEPREERRDDRKEEKRDR